MMITISNSYISTKFGNVLVLDGIIQCTERDEFVYHEMMAHLPLFSHPNPKKASHSLIIFSCYCILQVLIVGGGDGGVLREVAKHDGVEEIHQCEIDEVCISKIVNKAMFFYFQRVIEISKQYLPSIAIGYESPKLTVHIEDVTTFIDNHINEYDVIIVDSSDYDRGIKNLTHYISVLYYFKDQVKLFTRNLFTIKSTEL